MTMTFTPQPTPLRTFQARWDAPIAHLRPKEQTSAQKVLQVAYLIISIALPVIGLIRLMNYFVQQKISHMILPAQNMARVLNVYVRENYFRNSLLMGYNFTISGLKLKTPDGVELRGMHFKHGNLPENGPTTIIYQPNCMSCFTPWYSWLLMKAYNGEPCNFVVFDYRGCGASENSAHSKDDLLIDGETIHQFVRDELGVDHPHYYGFSLGGIAAEVKALHPESTGNIVIDRSFDEAANVPKSILPYTPIHQIGTALIKHYNWNIQPAKVWNQLSGRKLVVYHPEDPMMRRASLYNTLQERGLIDQALELQVDYETNYHVVRFDNCHTHDGGSVEDSVYNFLLNAQENRQVISS